MRFTTLGKLLQDPDLFDWAEMLYLPSTSWDLDTEALIASTDDLPPDHPIPAEARQAGMREIVPVATVQDIIENLHLQVAGCSQYQRLAAFRFYIEHDAFASIDMLE